MQKQETASDYRREDGQPLNDGPSMDTMTINMGPQHPSTHGVLRLILTINGETVLKAVPDIGFLHTGIEKTAEAKSYHQALNSNLGYSLAVEKLLGIEEEISEKIQFVRVALAELQRIASHLVWLGTHALDLGAMSVFLYCFREREVILDIFEEISGVRMMTSYICPGGLQADLTPGFEKKVRAFTSIFPTRLHEYHDLLTSNQLWIERTRGIGLLSARDALAYGVSGPTLRGSNVVWDIRKAFPYSGYEKFDFQIPVGSNGDVYDRYLVRMLEMQESLNIVNQAMDGMPTGPYRVANPKIAPPPKWQITGSMEALIHHFKLFTEGYRPPKGEVFVRTEAPKGELGFYIVSDGSAKPYRMHVRAPSFANLEALPLMVEGGLLSDVVAAIGSIDIVLGEVDR
jgi:NADH-quinone oxidoreductase subunit D